ncbi:flagellar basal body L-ring protein FlgH, partial [Morganella morganii]
MTESGIVPRQQDCASSPATSVCGRGLVTAAVLAVSLSGCAYIKPKPLVDTHTTALPVAPTAPAANGAIFQSAQPAYYGYQPLFEDRRPRNVGDILTINLQENV